MLANQMLSLAKVAQLAQENPSNTIDWAVVLREVALDLSPLIADRELDFDIDTVPSPIQTHDWMLRANSPATCCTTPSAIARRVARCTSRW